MMKKQNITKILIVASLTIVPWSLNASPSSNDHFSDGVASSITAGEVQLLKKKVIGGLPLPKDPLQLKQLFPGFVECKYDIGDDFNADCVLAESEYSESDFESGPPSDSEVDDGLGANQGRQNTMEEENMGVHCGESTNIRKRTQESVNRSLRNTIGGQMDCIEQSVRSKKYALENGQDEDADYAESIAYDLRLVRYIIQ